MRLISPVTQEIQREGKRMAKGCGRKPQAAPGSVGSHVQGS